MITCPECIATRARMRAAAMKFIGKTPEQVVKTLTAIYGWGFFIRAEENAVYYRSSIGTVTKIKGF